MRIRYLKSLFCISADTRGILVDLGFRNGVRDFLSVFELIQIRKASSPVIRIAQGKRFPGILTVREKVNRYLLRANAVLVILVIPYLCDDYARFPRRIFIGDGIARFGIACNYYSDRKSVV